MTYSNKQVIDIILWLISTYLSLFFLFPTPNDEWAVDALKDLYLQDTVYHIKSKQNTNALSTLAGIVPQGPYITLF